MRREFFFHRARPRNFNRVFERSTPCSKGFEWNEKTVEYSTVVCLSLLRANFSRDVIGVPVNRQQYVRDGCFVFLGFASAS